MSANERPDLESLQATARTAAAEWGVELGEPFRLARFSFVAPAGDDAVLKVTPAADDESDHEADALELWDGDGAVRLFRCDRAHRVLLLERARPGHDASSLADDEATAVAIDVGARLWRPAQPPFRRIVDHIPRWLDNAGEHPLLPIARKLYSDLDIRHDVVVHGDFHHHNLLRHGDRWVAIDAKAMLGEREYDVPSFLWNPLVGAGGSLPYDRTVRRLEAFEGAGLDPWRMRAWTAIRGAYLGADEAETETILRLLG